MSRIGKQIIALPAGVTATFDGRLLNVVGPKGSLSRDFLPDIAISLNEDKTITLKPVKNTVLSKALWGTYGSHIINMIEGVTTGFVKKLILEGIGYKVSLQANKVVMALGFSHPVEVIVPADLTVVVEKNTITISGIDKERVGQFAAKIRSYKVTEPYKGKGIRYEGEFVRRKQGKKTVG